MLSPDPTQLADEEMSSPSSSAAVVAGSNQENAAPLVVRVLLDGRPVAPSEAGQDVQFDGSGNSFVLVDEPRLYALVELEEFGSHALQLGSNSAGLSLFAFTFGAYDQGP